MMPIRFIKNTAGNRRTQSLHASLFILLLAVPLAHAQETDPTPILPGDEALDVSILKPHAARYRLMRNDAYWATAIIQLREAEVLQQPAFRHAYALHFSGQTVFDETLFLGTTLAPVMKFIHGGLPPDLAYKVYNYNGTRITGTNNYADGRDPDIIDVTHEMAMFGGGMGYLAHAALPLAEGYTFHFASGDDQGHRLQMIQVVGQETLMVNGATYETWVLESEGQKTWLSKEAPYLIRKAFPEAGIVWELAEVLYEGAWYKPAEQ